MDPLGAPELLGDLVDLHVAAGIELRVLDALGPFWRAVRRSTLAFSGVRLANANPSV